MIKRDDHILIGQIPLGYRKGNYPYTGLIDVSTFIYHIEICMITYAEHIKNPQQNLNREASIKIILTVLNNPKTIQSHIIPNIKIIIEMICKNIFRPITHKEEFRNVCTNEIPDPVDDDISWTYIEGIYRIFVQLILLELIDGKILKIYITPQFIRQFIELFDSENINERDYLVNILHKLYAKIINRRREIRKEITNCFLTIIHECRYFYGASDLLRIMISIICGYKVPLCAEHIAFFKNIIIPLHKTPTFVSLWEQLTNCIIPYITMDSSLAIQLLEGLLRYWPFANTQKEIAFLRELRQIIVSCEITKIESLIPKLFKQISKCISTLHNQITVQASSLFNDDRFLFIVREYKKLVFPIIVPLIAKLEDCGIDGLLLDCIVELKKKLEHLDKAAFEEALVNVKPQLHSIPDDRWEILHKRLKYKHPDMVEPDIPFTAEHISGKYNSLYSRIFDDGK